MLSLLGIARSYAKPYWILYLLGFLSLFLTTWITILIPQWSKQILNTFHELSSVHHLKIQSLELMGLGLLQIFVRSLSRLFIFWPGRKIEANLKNYFFDRFLNLQKLFFDRSHVGDLLSRLSNDVNQLRAFFAFGLLQTVNLIMLSFFSIYHMFLLDSALTFFTLSPLFLAIIMNRIGMPLFRKYSFLKQEALGNLAQQGTESFVHIHTIQATNSKELFVRKINNYNEKVYNVQMKLVLVESFLFPLSSLLTGFSYLMVLFYGGKEVLAHHLTMGDLLAFNIYIALLSFPLSSIGFISAMYQSAKGVLKRFDGIEKESLDKNLTKKHLPVLTQDKEPYSFIEIKNLTFFYSFSQKPALKNISLRIKEGSVVGIVGSLGSGKTTLFNLLTRLYSPPEQTIFFKGQDILSFDTDKLRKEFGYVLQSPYLFSDTIRNNLTFGYAGETSEQTIKEHLKRSVVLKDIEGFPDGLETQIGEKGVRLSGGQKQRLAFSRMSLRDPPILFLDDITSALDQKTALELVSNILHKKDKTLLVVSHLSSILKKCDVIFILENGSKIAEGTFEELLTSYRHLFS